MKKFLMVSALSILFSSSIITCSEDKNSNLGRNVVGAFVVVGLGYMIYQQIKSNPSSDNPSSTPNLSSHNQSQQKEEEKPNLREQLNNQSSSDSEKSQSTDNKTLSSLKPKSKTEKEPLHGNPTKSQENTNIPAVNTEKQISFSDALRARFKESEIELDAKRLLTEHAFSN